METAEKKLSIEEWILKFAHGMDLADDPDMENTADEWFDYMLDIDAGIEKKFDGCAEVRSRLKSEIDRQKALEAKHASRKRALENAVKHLESRMLNAMEITGKTKFKTDENTFYIQKNPATVIIDCDVLDLPKELIKYKDPEADKKAIKAILDSGAEFPFAHLVQTESLRIR